MFISSDIGHGYYRPETGDQVRESNPGPTKKIVCKAKGLNPGPTKKIVPTIVHAIAKYDRAQDRKFSRARRCTNEFHVERVRWTTDNGQTDQKKKQTTDRPF